MPALDAYTVKQEVWETLHSARFHAYAETYTATLRGEMAEEAYPVHGIPFVASGDDYVRREVAALRMSETFYVAPMMSRLVTAAAESWPDDEPVAAEDWPSPYGFLYVPGGVSTLDARGQMNVTVAFLWSTVGGVTYVTWWTDKAYDPPELTTRPGHADLPRFSPWHVTRIRHGTPLPTALTMGRVIPPEVGEQMRWHEQVNPDGTRSAMLYLPEGWTPEQMTPHVGVDRVSAWLVSSLRIMRSTLAAPERRGMPAHLRRRLARHPLRLRQRAVTVIDFRRREPSGSTGERVEYSHRFLVRGHWRRQWYGSGEDRHQVRIWIHPFLKGPEDKPVELREHVSALVR